MGSSEQHGASNLAIVLAIVVIGILAVVMVFATSLILNPISVEATVTNSTQYNAGTIQNNQTYNVVGYNLTLSYHGLISHQEVLCPLYPVGSKIQVGYSNWFWLFPSIVGLWNTPQGCQTNTGL